MEHGTHAVLAARVKVVRAARDSFARTWLAKIHYEYSVGSCQFLFLLQLATCRIFSCRLPHSVDPVRLTP